MIYSAYNESAYDDTVDFFAEGTNYGISVPTNFTNAQQDAFMAGLMEASMLSCFEKIGAHEQYCLENYMPVNENTVFDAIKTFFGNVLEAIKKFFAKVIQWISDKVAEFGKKMREKQVAKWTSKDVRNNLLKGKNINLSSLLLKTKYITPETAPLFAQDGTKAAHRNLEKGVHAITVLAEDILFGKKDGNERSSVVKAAIKAALSNDSNVDGANTIEAVKKAYDKVWDKEKEISYEDALNMLDSLKKIVINGSQKATVKKIYETEKRAINKMLGAAKRTANKDDKEIKKKIAMVKDIVSVMDAIGRLSANTEQKAFVEARKILVALFSKSKLAYTGESASFDDDFGYVW